MGDAVDRAHATFTAALERALAAGDDDALILEAFTVGANELRDRDDLDDDEAERAAAHYEALVGGALAAEDLAVRALSAVVYDAQVVPGDRLRAAAAWIWERAEDEDQAEVAVAHAVYLSDAEDRLPVIVIAWGLVRQAWLGITKADDPGADARSALLACDPRMVAVAELVEADDAALRVLSDGLAVVQEHGLHPSACQARARRQLEEEDALSDRQKRIAGDVVGAVTADHDPFAMVMRRQEALVRWYERILVDSDVDEQGDPLEEDAAPR